MRYVLFPLLTLSLLLGTCTTVRAQTGGVWESPFGTTLNDVVRAFAFAENGDLYVAGDFTEAGGQVVNHVARWDGTSWEALGSGVNDYVHAIAIVGGYVYVGGRFVRAGNAPSPYIARWNGSEWEAVGGGLADWVEALVVRGDDLFVGGRFGGGVTRWDGANWHALGGGLDAINRERYHVYSLAADSDFVYAGGTFRSAEGRDARGIARWDGETWSSLGTSISGGAFAIAIDARQHLIAAGQFSEAGGQAAANVARWDGESWSPMGDGLVLYVSALAIAAGELFAGGTHLLGSEETGYQDIAHWTGLTWEPLGAGLGEMFVGVYGLGAQGGRLYVGGSFSEAGGLPAANAAVWNTGLTSTTERSALFQEGAAKLSIYPNPVKGVATITIAMAQSGPVRLAVYDVLGREVGILVDRVFPAGTHPLSWLPGDLPSGVYYLRLTTDTGAQTRTATLIQ